MVSYIITYRCPGQWQSYGGPLMRQYYQCRPACFHNQSHDTSPIHHHGHGRSSKIKKFAQAASGDLVMSLLAWQDAKQGLEASNETSWQIVGTFECRMLLLLSLLYLLSFSPAMPVCWKPKGLLDFAGDCQNICKTPCKTRWLL